MSIKSKITRFSGSQKLRVKESSPHILFGIGLAGTVASTVLACRATLKLEAKLAEAQDEINEVGESFHKGLTDRKDLAYVYGKHVCSIGRLYAPAVAVGVVSISCLTGSHVQLTRRNTALTAAYTGLHTAFNEYRARVRKALGEENERDLYFDTQIENTTDENGKKITVKTLNPNNMSIYAKCFDEFNPEWKKNAEFNKIFIKCQQEFANQRLQVVGHIFLNEVYDSLGFERTQAGQVVGWYLNDEGDNFVDFGLFEAHNHPFMNGQERSIWLDFNVDGVITTKALRES